MMDNATFRENMNAVAVAASKVSTQAKQAQEPGVWPRIFWRVSLAGLISRLFIFQEDLKSVKTTTDI